MSDQGRLQFDPIEEARRQWVAHGWDDASDGMAIVTSIMRAEQIFLTHADSVLRPLDLTFARYEVLMLLMFSRRGEMPLGKIGQRLQVGAASVTNAITRLEVDGLVRRRTNPEDGRGVMGAITPQGKRLARKATSRLNRYLFETIPLPKQETDILFKILHNFRHAAGDFQ